MPAISIVLPTYNRADMLREAIQSALNQTFQDFEIIVSDNASTDGTADVVASFAEPRIRYFRQSSNLGMTPNWKFAVAQASADWIAPLADDDHYLPDHLEVGISALRRHPTVAFHTCPAEYFGDTTGGVNRPAFIEDTTTSELLFEPYQAVEFLGIDHPGPMNNMVCRKADLLEVFWGPPGYIPQDLLIMTQLMIRGGFVFSNRITTRYRVHAAMASQAVDDVAKTLRFNLMVWYGVRYLAQFLLDQAVCRDSDIEQHGLLAKSSRHVVPLVLGLASLDASPALRQMAKRIFAARKDMDIHSSRFRLARRAGFWMLPLLERWTQQRVGWRPRS